MRIVLALTFFLATSGTFALVTEKSAVDANNNTTTMVTDADLTTQCSQFVKSCVDICESQVIHNISSTCLSRDATCTCNGHNISATVFTTLLKVNVTRYGKNKLQVETDVAPSKNVRKAPIQSNAFLGERDNSTIEEEDKGEQVVDDQVQADEGYVNEEYDDKHDGIAYGEEYGGIAYDEQESYAPKHREYAQAEFIYPQQNLVKSVRFQQSYCAQFLTRCKQDCPAASSSHSCDTNPDSTGFLLSCMCNDVDIASSVNAQVQAESKNNFGWN